MRTCISAVSALLLAGVAYSASPEPPLVEATIGTKLPAKYLGQNNNVRAFTIIRVPILHPTLQAELHDVNLFSDSGTGILAGFRGDRAMQNQSACRSAAERVDAILRPQFPIAYKGNDPKYQHQSKTGDVVAGVRCSKVDGVDTLTLEVTNPTLEDRLMQKARNER